MKLQLHGLSEKYQKNTTVILKQKRIIKNALAHPKFYPTPPIGGFGGQHTILYGKVHQLADHLENIFFNFNRSPPTKWGIGGQIETF